MDEKQCSKCGEVKPLEAFGQHRSRRDGLSSECKSCIKERNHAYYLANVEKTENGRHIGGPTIEISTENKNVDGERQILKRLAHPNALINWQMLKKRRAANGRGSKHTLNNRERLHVLIGRQILRRRENEVVSAMLQTLKKNMNAIVVIGG